MGLETVKIYCYDQQVVPALVDGVLVRVYNEAGSVFITQDYTGNVIPGAVEFTLDGAADPNPTKYTIRMSKTGVAFDGILGDKSKSPQLISIYSPPLTTNNFEVYCNVFPLPVSSNPALCRCSCRIFNVDGTPFDGAAIHIQPEYIPLAMSDGNNAILLAGKDFQLRTSVYNGETAMAVIDLPRTGIFWVTIEGLADQPRQIHVPDLDGYDLVKLMFPVIESVVYAPTSLALAVGASTTVTPTVTASDTRVLTGTAQDDVEYASSDTSVAQVAVSETYLTITGLAPGSATISASAKDTSISFLPPAAITQTPVTVTVS